MTASGTVEPPRVYSDVEVTVTSSVAAALIERAGIVPGRSAHCWRLPNGLQTTDARTALTEALVVIAEDDLAATLHDSLARETASEARA